MSDGSRSAVAWTRWNEPPSERAKARASVVLPLPGTSSMSAWPPESNAQQTSSTAAVRPCTTCSTLTMIDRAEAVSAARGCWAGSCAWPCGSSGVLVTAGSAPSARHG